MSVLKVGQILWLKIRFNNNGDVSSCEHPYLILEITEKELKTVEVGQLDSLKAYKLAYKSNKPIYVTNPNETVLYKDSYIQLDNKISIEYFDELIKFRKTADTLSEKRLKNIIDDYHEFHNTHIIAVEKVVYISKDELLCYNSNY